MEFHEFAHTAELEIDLKDGAHLEIPGATEAGTVRDTTTFMLGPTWDGVSTASYEVHVCMCVCMYVCMHVYD